MGVGILIKNIFYRIRTNDKKILEILQENTFNNLKLNEIFNFKEGKLDYTSKWFGELYDELRPFLPGTTYKKKKIEHSEKVIALNKIKTIFLENVRLKDYKFEKFSIEMQMLLFFLLSEKEDRFTSLLFFFNTMGLDLEGITDDYNIEKINEDNYLKFGGDIEEIFDYSILGESKNAGFQIVEVGYATQVIW